MFKPKLSELLLASFKLEDYNPSQTKILLLNAIINEEIYTLADEALYQAKSAGRNQIVYSNKKV